MYTVKCLEIIIIVTHTFSVYTNLEYWSSWSRKNNIYIIIIGGVMDEVWSLSIFNKTKTCYNKTIIF